MTKRIWIKLYIEILDDPKMGRLTNHCWRRAVELFLLAGRQGNDGALPPVEEMAWTLRLSEDKVLEDLHSLAEVGMVHEAEPGLWSVTHFAKRQAAMSVEERVRRYRSGNEVVTKRYNNCNEEAGVASTSPSVYDSNSGSSEEERVQGEEEPRAIPSSPVEAMLHPDVRVFSAVTGGRIPGLTQYRTVIDTVQLLRQKKQMDDRALAAYLAPYWQTWSGRKRQDGRPYDPGNISWLTDWALNGTMPGEKKLDPDVAGKVERFLNKV